MEDHTNHPSEKLRQREVQARAAQAREVQARSAQASRPAAQAREAAPRPAQPRQVAREASTPAHSASDLGINLHPQLSTAPSGTTAPLSAGEPSVDAAALAAQIQFRLFAVLWAAASLLVVWQRRELATLDSYRLVLHAGIVVASLIVLFRPRLAWSTVLIGALHCAHVCFESPFLRSTDWLFGFFGATMVLSYLCGIIIYRSWRIGGGQLYRSCAPTLRIVLVMSLVAMGLARLNWSFLNVSTSPINSQLEQLQQLPGSTIAQWGLYFTMSALVVVDLFLAIALLTPSLRRFAVGFGSAYFCLQAVLGLGDAPHLYAFFLVGLALFCSAEFTLRLHSQLQYWAPLPALRSHGLGLVVILMGMLTAVVWAQQRNGEISGLSFQRCVAMEIAVVVLFWLVLLLSNLIDFHPKLTWISMAPRNALHYGLVLLLFFFLASPYLGLGNYGRLTDHSGLVNLDTRSNHLFLPQKSMTTLDDEWVQVIESDDAYLAHLAESGQRLTWFDLVNYVRAHPEISLSYSRNEKYLRLAGAADLPDSAGSNSWWARRLVCYQPVTWSISEGLRNSRSLAANVNR